MELFDIFSFHLLTPGENSVLVNQEFEQFLSKSGGNSLAKIFQKQQSEKNFDSDGTVCRFDGISCLKYIARKHGLPRVFAPKLIEFLKSTHPSFSKENFQITQILKHSVAKDSGFIKFEECLNTLDYLVQVTSGGNYQQGIISQLVQCIGLKINSENHNKSIASRLTKFLPLVNFKTKTEILKKLERWEVSLELNQNQHVNEFDSEIEIESDQVFSQRNASGIVVSKGIAQLGGDILRERHAHERAQKKDGGKIQADAVKTQQVVASSYKQNVSEKTELESISLSNALNSNRSRAIARNTNSTTTPRMRGIGGSDRWWYRTTGAEISNLATMADQKQPIKDDDINWLRDKTCFGFALSNTTVTMYELGRIAGIFNSVIHYQEIPSGIVTDLAHNFFSKNLDSSYENSRMKLLSMFETFAQKLKSGEKIPEKFSEILRKFKTMDTCTADMKRKIWKIFATNDDNFFDSFESALEILMTGDDDIETQRECLEFIGSQVVFEQRGRQCQEKFEFVPKLLEIIRDSSRAHVVRIQAAEVIEDYLAYDENGLNKEWLDIYIHLHQDFKEFKSWDEESKVKFQTSLIRSILRTLDKGTIPSQSLIKMLIDLAVENQNRKLEALIVISLGNLNNRSISIPGPQKLGYKLLRLDRVDDLGCVYLEGDSEEEDGGNNETYISAIVANILLKANPKLTTETLNYLIEAIQISPDKMTRILSCEIIFNASLSPDQIIPEYILSCLRPLAMDPIPDIQIYLTSAYCLTLEKFSTMPDFKIGSDDLNWFPSIYAWDNSLVLGSKNFAQYVNEPIMNILNTQAPNVQFPETIFQLFTFILNENSESEKVLKIIEKNIKGQRSQSHSVPTFCVEAIENLFRSEDKLYKLTADVLILADIMISDESIEFAHQNFTSETNFGESRNVSFKILLQAQNIQDLPEFIFQDLDMELMCLNLVQFLNNSNLEEIELSEFGNLFPKVKKTTDDIERVKSGLCSILEYQGRGRKLSILSFYLMEIMLSIQSISEQVIQCLIYSAENGQSISAPVIQAALENFDGQPQEIMSQNNFNILALAFGIVHNNQTLPSNFIGKLVDTFCKQTARGQSIGENELFDKILFILAKLAQTSQTPLPRAGNVAQHFCNLWVNSGRNARRKMGVLMTWQAQGGKIKENELQEAPADPMEKAKEVLRRACQFWKKSQTQRHRLEILGALSGIANSALLGNQRENSDACAKGKNSKEVNLKQIHKIFREAMQDKNLRILETGLQAFISMNWNGAKYCEEQDFKILFSIQSKSNVSKSIVENIHEFLVNNLSHLPPFVRAELKLFEDISEADDEHFVKKLEYLFCIDSQESDHAWRAQLRDVTFFKNRAFMGRIQNILIRKNGQSLELVCQTMEIICKFHENISFPASIYESIGFAMITNSECEAVQNIGRKIITKLMVDGDTSSISEKLANYLLMSKNPDLLEIQLQISKNQNLENYEEVELKYKIQSLLQGLNNPAKTEEDKIEIYKNFFILIGNSEEFYDSENTKLDKIFLDQFLDLIEKAEQNSKNEDSMLKIACTTAVELIENSILRSKSPSDSAVYKIYAKIIEKGFAQNLKECVEEMTELFQKLLRSESRNEYEEILISMLEALTSAAKLQNSKTPIETFKLFGHLVRDPNPTIRTKSFETFQFLSDEQTKKLCEEEDKHSTFDFESMILGVFKQIFENEEEARIEIDKDPDFTYELFGLLFSLKYWDLHGLKPFKYAREEWQKLLVISNFITAFAESENRALEMALCLQRIYKNLGNKNANELINLAAQKISDEYEDEKIIIQILLNLNQLPIETFIKILNEKKKFDDNMEILGATERAVVSNLLSEKFKFKIGAAILDVLAQRFIFAIGVEFAQNLLSSITCIEDMKSLDDFIQLMDEIEDKQRVFKAINRTSIAQVQFSIQDAKILLEAQLLSTLLPNGVRESRFLRIFVSLLKAGISRKQLTDFLELSKLRSGEKDFLKVYEHVIFQCHQYQATSSVFIQITSALKNSDLVWNTEDCIRTCSRILNDLAFEATNGGVKPIDKIISEFIHKNSLTLDARTLKNRIVAIADTDSQAKSMICTNSSKPIRNWSAWEIQEWALWVKVKAGENDPRVKSTEFITEALMVVKRGFHLITNFHLTHVQILTCLMALDDKVKNKGKLLQVATGSGKSAIIGMIATIKSLQGNSVDVYTSSSVLAERDAKEWSKFYNLFRLTCDHNGDKSNCYISGAKSCYAHDIVYGDCSQFQFDYLRDTYSDLGTLGGRSCAFALVDEVDAMFIDDSSKLARLSSTLPGMDLLQIMYHLIWDRLSFIKNHLFQFNGHIFYMEGQLGAAASKGGGMSYSFAHEVTNQLQTIPDVLAYISCGFNLKQARIYPISNVDSFIVDHLKNYGFDLIKKKTIKLPRNLEEFACSQIPKWVDSALTAEAFQENVHYVVDDGQVKPVDFQTTGVVQASTNWNNGLHQFIQIKHGLRLNSESVTTNFLSNLAMFQKYEGNVVGFTGTLGSETGKSVLGQVYGVDLLIIPEVHFKRYVRFPDFIASGEGDWFQEILITTLEETSKRRGVLIICETIKQAEVISATLEKFKQVKVKLYTKNSENQEKQIERIHPGDVIVATNLAGRGTDIKTADVEEYGGLHVCLTFLPGSLRVEEQAFGRTSRQGKRGTGQLIVSAPAHAQSTNFELVAQRDAEEKKLLLQFQNEELPIIQIKDKLFSQFSKVFQDFRQDYRSKNNSYYRQTMDYVKKNTKIGSVSPTTGEVIYLSAVEERWAMFLRKFDDGQNSSKTIQSDFIQFEKQLSSDWNSDQIIQNSSNLFYFIQLGNYEFSQDSKFNKRMDKAQAHFDHAIAMDPQFASGALVGKGYAMLKGRVNVVWFDSHEKGYKEAAIEVLQRSLPLLHEEMAMITVIQTLVNKQSLENPSLITQQLTEKSNLLGSYIKNVSGTISTIEKSLRQIYCTGISGKLEETQLIPDSVIQSSAREIPGAANYERYNLEFNDLTWRQDTGFTHDQAIETLSDSKTEQAKRLLKRMKTWKGDAGPNMNDCSIRLSCPQADLAAIASSAEILKQKFQLNLEIFDVKFEDDKLSFDFDKIISKSNNLQQFSLEIGFESSQDWEFVMTSLGTNGLAGQCKTAEIKWTNPEKGNHKFKKLISLENRDEIHDCKQILAKSEMVEKSIKFIDLKFPAQMDEILKGLKYGEKLESKSTTLNMTIQNIQDKNSAESIKMLWNYVGQNFERTITHLVSMDRNAATKIIPELRKLKCEFILHVENMSLPTARFVLQKADVEQEDIVQGDVKELTQLYMADSLPLAELRDLSARGICLIVTFNERAFVPWISIAGVVAIAAVQVTLGGVLICTGFGATVGMGLITEGMSDLVTAQRIYSTREFSWGSYATQKAVSLTISAVSMGLSSLKDAGKGVALIAEKGVTEVVETAGTKVLVNGKILNATIATAGKNLKSLAVKHIAVSVVETGARVGLKSLGDSLAGFAFDQVKGGIVQNVSGQVKNNFYEAEFIQIMSYYATGLDHARLSYKVKEVLDSTMNPKSTGWLGVWSSIGSPLMNGILSSPQFLGSSYARVTMIYGLVTGMTEIATVVTRVSQEIRTKLNQDKPRLELILQSKCGISKETATAIASQIRFKSEHSFEVDFIPNCEEKSKVKEGLKQLAKIQKGFDIKSSGNSLMLKTVVDGIANHIVRIANSHLVSPVMAGVAGTIVAKISAQIQDRFLVDSSQNTDEQNKTIEKVQELKNKNPNQRTKEENEFLAINDVANTFANQINANAKDYKLAWQKREIVAKAMQKNEGNSNLANKTTSVSEKTMKNLGVVAVGVLDGDPADMAIMFSMAAENGVDIKIVDDPNYVPSQEEIDSGIRIVLYEKGEGNQVGHYSLLNPTGEEAKALEGATGNSMDCGYQVLGALTNKSVDQLRVESSERILNNPEQFKEIQETSNWLRERYPQESMEHLMVGGKKGERRSRSRSRNRDGLTQAERNEAEAKRKAEIEKNREETLAKGLEPGGSGKPRRHFIQANSKAEAKDAAMRNEPHRGSRAKSPINHPPHKRGQSPHFHPVDAQGNKSEGGVHILYPSNATMRGPDKKNKK